MVSFKVDLKSNAQQLKKKEDLLHNNNFELTPQLNAYIFLHIQLLSQCIHVIKKLFLKFTEKTMFIFYK